MRAPPPFARASFLLLLPALACGGDAPGAADGRTNEIGPSSGGTGGTATLGGSGGAAASSTGGLGGAAQGGTTPAGTSTGGGSAGGAVAGNGGTDGLEIGGGGQGIAGAASGASGSTAGGTGAGAGTSGSAGAGTSGSAGAGGQAGLQTFVRFAFRNAGKQGGLPVRDICVTYEKEPGGWPIAPGGPGILAKHGLTLEAFDDYEQLSRYLAFDGQPYMVGLTKGDDCSQPIWSFVLDPASRYHTVVVTPFMTTSDQGPVEIVVPLSFADPGPGDDASAPSRVRMVNVTAPNTALSLRFHGPSTSWGGFTVPTGFLATPEYYFEYPEAGAGVVSTIDVLKNNGELTAVKARFDLAKLGTITFRRTTIVLFDDPDRPTALFCEDTRPFETVLGGPLTNPDQSGCLRLESVAVAAP